MTDELEAIEFAHVVDGKLLESTKLDCCKDPRTSEPLWNVPVANEEDLQLAITAAQKAFPIWSKRPLAERQGVLRQLVDVLREKREFLAMIVSKETGKSVSETRIHRRSILLMIW
jgi:acyl-CoA reductase-like NAD-dependent aldehyde dehydrogenase